MRIFFAQNDLTGSGFYRCQLPASALKIAGHDVECGMIYDYNYWKLYDSDLVVLQMQHQEEWLKVIADGRKNGCCFVYDLDDNIFAMHDGIPQRQLVEKQKPMMLEIMRTCDAVTVSTPYLAHIISELHPNVFVNPNYVLMPKMKPIPHKRLRIGWSGSDSHSVDFQSWILDALSAIMEQHDVEVIFVGWIPEKLIGKASFMRFVNPNQYLDLLSSLSIDIGLIPCDDIPFNHARSLLKFYEYSICGMTSVMSAVFPYTTIDTSFGVFAENTYDAWYNAIANLILRSNHRNALRKKAKQYVIEHHLLKNNIDAIDALYDALRRSYGRLYTR